MTTHSLHLLSALYSYGVLALTLALTLTITMSMVTSTLVVIACAPPAHYYCCHHRDLMNSLPATLPIYDARITSTVDCVCLEVGSQLIVLNG